MTMTTTPTKLVATEGVLRPRAYVTKGYRTHAEPNFWPQPEPEVPREAKLPWGAVIALLVGGAVSGAAMWAVVHLAGLSGML